MERKGYDHGKYAGNAGDVWKHAALAAVLEKLAAPKAGGFSYFETHAGPGECTLAPGGGWTKGVGRMPGSLTDPLAFAGGAFRGYLQRAAPRLVRGERYLGSWRLAEEILKERAPGAYRLTLCERNPHVVAAAKAYATSSAVDLLEADGFAALPARLDASLVLIDPPYVAQPGEPHDWDRVHEAARLCKQHGTAFLVWYPVFWKNNPDRLVRETGLVGHEALWGEPPSHPGAEMTGAGLLAGGAAGEILRELRGALHALAERMGAVYRERR